MQVTKNGKDVVYYAVLEIERHFHGRERWYGANGTTISLYFGIHEYVE